MPAFPEVTKDDLKALKAYIINQPWKGDTDAAKKDAGQTR